MAVHLQGVGFSKGLLGTSALKIVILHVTVAERLDRRRVVCQGMFSLYVNSQMHSKIVISCWIVVYIFMSLHVDLQRAQKEFNLYKRNSITVDNSIIPIRVFQLVRSSWYQ